MEIKGKVGVITGGSSGIGRATSERLAKEGAAIVVADLDEAGGAETVKRIESAGGRAVFVKADVTKLDDARRMLDTAMSKYGRLDILHNNAGIGVGAPGYPDAPPERWHLVIEIDLQAVILGTGLSAPLMQKNGGGVIINTASMAGLYPHRQDAVYGAAKGGVVNFTHSLASWDVGAQGPRQLHLPGHRRYSDGATRIGAGEATRHQELDAVEDNPARRNRGRSSELGARRLALRLLAGGAPDRPPDCRSAAGTRLPQIKEGAALLRSGSRGRSVNRNSFEFGAQFALGAPEVAGLLHPQPDSGSVAAEPAEPRGHPRRNRYLLGHNPM